MRKKYIYIGGGSYIIGLPARDIEDEEWETYPEDITKAALKEGLYKVTDIKEVKHGTDRA